MQPEDNKRHVMHRGRKQRGKKYNKEKQRQQISHWKQDISEALNYKILRKKHNCHPIILYPVKISFKNKGKIKSSSDIQKSKEHFLQSFRLKENDTRCKYGSTCRNEEH